MIHLKENCCCKCKHQFKLMKHPFNKEIGKGSITEQLGFVCTVSKQMDSNSDWIIYFEKEHGECELFTKK